MTWLVELSREWYLLLSQLTAQLGPALQSMLSATRIPGLAALLLGLFGALAPCQVSGNAAAITYVSRSDSQQGSLWRTVGGFLGGKVTVYVILGFLAAVLGFQLPIPVMALLRKLSGPLMILIGLHFLGLLRLRGGALDRLGLWIQERTPRRGSPAFWLGVAFSLSFCPTMALIFFGALIPLVLKAQAGLVLTAVFAVGTAVPVLLWAGALSLGKRVAGRWVRNVRRADPVIRLVAAAVMIFLGLSDTLLYWFN